MMIQTGSVTIGGTATQGETLTASNDLADADGLETITYSWSNGQTGSSITLGQGDVGETITVTASYTDTLGTEESVASSATSAVANVNDDPTGSVTIGGTATQGETLTASNDLADADGLETIPILGVMSNRIINYIRTRRCWRDHYGNGILYRYSRNRESVRIFSYFSSCER